jgi:prepilin-type processing-associated H-X9-DG protein
MWTIIRMAFVVPPGESFCATPMGDRHQQGANLLFADTHAEYWKWSKPMRSYLYY